MSKQDDKNDEKTLISEANKKAEHRSEDQTKLHEEPSQPIVVKTFEPVEVVPDKKIQKEKTTLLKRPEGLFSSQEKARSKLPKRSFLVLVLLAIVVFEMMDDDEAPIPKAQAPVVMKAIRPQLPAAPLGKANPEASVKIYNEGLKPYAEDTVQGYRKAVDVFHLSLRHDPENVKALAMLASSYLNLIDSSNKDENTFQVINKLIELSRVKQLDLVETLIAEVEFLMASRRFDAAKHRLTEYSKMTGRFDPVSFYYIALIDSELSERGTEKLSSAMNYLNLIPASALPIPKLYYLRGYIHEQNGEHNEAVTEYKRALKLNSKHAKSILGLIRMSEKQGRLKEMLRFIQFLTNHPSLQNPREYVSTLIFRNKIAQLFHQPDVAIQSLEKALQIDPKDEELRLDYYSLLSQSEKKSHYRDLAKMYALVLDGERNVIAGKTHEAILVFIQAKDAFPKSEIPLIKMGDLFLQLGEHQKAVNNYKKALDLNPKSPETAIKLMDALIRHHDWDEAQKYLSKYRTHPAVKSSIDRLAGDIAFHQGDYPHAVEFYRKAMARDSIDSEVYSSYATVLREVNQCKDAQFFYSVAQRLDPLSYSALIGSAKCLLKEDSVNAAVSRIQDELSRFPKARADYLVGIAEIYYLAHDDEKSLDFCKQAKALDPDYPESYKIEGLVYLRQMLTKKSAEAKALEALKAYSDRKTSDPYGYLQRFEIFLRESKFEEAKTELEKVFEVSPRYPELHFRRAQLYLKLGRNKEAIKEIQEELELNPRFSRAWVELGNLFILGQNNDEAMKAFIKAMELDPQYAAAKMGAGYVNYLKRQFSSAIALYQAALALDRGNPEIYKKLGLVYRDSGDMQKAKESFRSYLDLAPDAPDRSEFEKFR